MCEFAYHNGIIAEHVVVAEIDENAYGNFVDPDRSWAPRLVDFFALPANPRLNFLQQSSHDARPLVTALSMGMLLWLARSWRVANNIQDFEEFAYNSLVYLYIDGKCSVIASTPPSLLYCRSGGQDTSAMRCVGRRTWRPDLVSVTDSIA